jgi:hypothetical protein
MTITTQSAKRNSFHKTFRSIRVNTVTNKIIIIGDIEKGYPWDSLFH